ncbi:MAG TPA: carbohydrate-binding module family 20 domain-containing protein [Anaerolineae bacterium]|nr:carbohydrate-binding module family 20 domain-containing protein [Anaerolineae bacterium]
MLPKLSSNLFSNFIRLTILALITLSALAIARPDAPIVHAAEPPRTAFVHLFEWKWTDIAQECENFLGPAGYAAVQVSPPNEHAIINIGGNYPWWERYQPVSYQIQSRSGSRAEFQDMVTRCGNVGVDIYVDAVINHMTGVGSGVGSAGTNYGYFSYPGLYGYNDFHHCGRNGNDDIQNYGDRWEVQNCELVNLADLDTGSEYVRSQLAAYLNDLIGMGVAGFRLDASKHMSTDDVNNIVNRLNGNPYIFQEVIDQGGEPITASEYFQNGDVTEFKYSLNLSNQFYSGQIKNLSQFGTAWGFMPDDKAVVFVDNHDNQRGHGGGGHIITHKDGALYDITNVFMLAWPYGYPKVMSSYDFTDGDQGPPSDAYGNTNTIYQNGSPNCFNEWKCEHRWRPIANMVAFRNHTSGQPVTNWWDNGNNQIAFSRGDQGFVAINKEGYALNGTFQTGLAAGTYCNVIAGDYANGACSGETVTVNSDGTANINVSAGSALALYAAASTNGGGGGGGTTQSVYSQMNLRGTANGWSNTAMTLVSDYTWEATVDFGATSNERFKLDVYGDWSLNYGDTNADGFANQFGSDIAVTQGAGSYTITFNDSTKAYTVTKNSGGGGGGGTSCSAVTVNFNVNNAFTNWGQNVYVVGSTPELGSWNPANAVLLSADNYPTWDGSVSMSAETAVSYKYIKIDGSGNVTWQSGADQTLTTPCSGSVNTNDSW